jgi:hypothetical protein
MQMPCVVWSERAAIGVLEEIMCQNVYWECKLCLSGTQGRPLGGASGVLAPGADFEGAAKRQSLTGQTLIRSTVA